MDSAPRFAEFHQIATQILSKVAGHFFAKQPTGAKRRHRAAFGGGRASFSMPGLYLCLRRPCRKARMRGRRTMRDRCCFSLYL